jgi:hypothetical protein
VLHADPGRPAKIDLVFARPYTISPPWQETAATPPRIDDRFWGRSPRSEEIQLGPLVLLPRRRRNLLDIKERHQQRTHWDPCSSQACSGRQMSVSDLSGSPSGMPYLLADRLNDLCRK